MLDEDQIDTAVNDAVLDRLRKPASEDSPEGTSLYAAAWCNCRDLAESEAHLKAREREWSDAYLLKSSADAAIARDEDAEQFVERIADLMPDDDMRATLRLWLVGERCTATYAARLGINDSFASTRVNREKNRMKMFLRRNPEVRKLASDFLDEGR